MLDYLVPQFNYELYKEVVTFALKLLSGLNFFLSAFRNCLIRVPASVARGSREGEEHARSQEPSPAGGARAAERAGLSHRGLLCPAGVA